MGHATAFAHEDIISAFWMQIAPAQLAPVLAHSWKEALVTGYSELWCGHIAHV
jgi:hypothetical protein